MLEGAFIEATQIYTDQHLLCLEDDDSRTFIEYLDVIYMVKSSDKAVPIDRLPDLAVLADRYESTECLRHMFSAVLSPLLREDLTWEAKGVSMYGISMQDILFMAYPVGDADLFWRASREVIAHACLIMLKQTSHAALIETMPVTLISE